MKITRDKKLYRTAYYLNNPEYVYGIHLDRFRMICRAYKMLGGFIEWAKIVHPEWSKEEYSNEEV